MVVIYPNDDTDASKAQTPRRITVKDFRGADIILCMRASRMVLHSGHCFFMYYDAPALSTGSQDNRGIFNLCKRLKSQVIAFEARI